jgi:outer membrane protein assembly factor BamB
VSRKRFVLGSSIEVLVGQVPRRSVVFAAVVVVMLIAAAVAAPLSLASSGDESTAYQSDVAHDGYIADAGLGPPLTQAWSVALTAPISYPLIVNGMVYVTASNATLYALNQATGTTVWSHSMGGNEFAELTYDRGRVFGVNMDGVLTAFDAATGSIAWSEQLPPGQAIFSSAPTAANGIVYVGGGSGSVYGVRESNGHVVWTQGVSFGNESSPAVGAQGIYVSYPCQAYKFDPLIGTLLWHDDEGCVGGGGRTPVVASGHVYVRDASGAEGPGSSPLVLSASTGAVEGAFNPGPAPAVANDVAYLLSGFPASTLTAVAGAGLGSTSWTFTGDGNLDTAPLVVGGLVFVGSSSGNLYALDAAAGTTTWSTNVGSPIIAPDEQDIRPLTGLGAANGTLVLSTDGELMAYRTAGAITTSPADQSPPTIDAFAQVDQIEAADVGIWSELPNAYTYQWELCDAAGANCADIPGATDATFTPPDADLAKTLRVTLVASNGVGSSAPVESAASAAIVGPAPTNQTQPTISGTLKQKEILTVDPGTWSDNPTGYGYQWRRCRPGDLSSCSDIPGATQSSYTIATSDFGSALQVRVIATNAGGNSDPAESALTPAVPAPPVNLAPPSLTGLPQVGKLLTADRGQWSNNPTSYVYQWLSCDASLNTCNAIGAATGSTYVVRPGDIERRLKARVVATNDGGDSAAAFSNATDPVLTPIPGNRVVPTISGKAQQGQILTAAPGNWSNNPTGYAYQWERCIFASLFCMAIVGATSTTYPVGSADVGATLFVRVVAANAGGNSRPAVSKHTTVVAGVDCQVPNVVGFTLAKAKTSLRTKHCGVGRITKQKASPAQRGRVLSQKPGQGRTLPNGAKVNLRIGTR